MICKSCGANLRDDARFCEHCGAKVESSAQAGQPSYSQPYADPSQSQGNSYNNAVQNAPAQGSGINDYLVGNIILSVLALLCCACPSLVTGIIGIVFSSLVKSALSAGKYDEAAQKAKTAKVLFFVTLGLVLLALVLSIISFSTGMLNGYLEEILYDLN